MWDDVLAIETLRSAHHAGAAVANYVEAMEPLWEEGRVVGFRVRDREKPEGRGEVEVRASKVIVCGGPWTDRIGQAVSPSWNRWLNPSKGVHLIFDLKRIPVPGAVVMSHPEDGRISFVIPRPDLGAGVTIVGTTDSPSPVDPGAASIEKADVQYLMTLLDRYFPDLQLKTSDILSGYVGVRPLMGAAASTAGSEGQPAGGGTTQLQKVSREHFIGSGPGGTVFVAGGKYTTHRKMAEEIIDFALDSWAKEHKQGRAPALPERVHPSKTRMPINPSATPSALQLGRDRAKQMGLMIPNELFGRYGAEALEVYRTHEELSSKDPGLVSQADPEGFPMLGAQLTYAIRNGMVMHLEDFYFRRLPLYAARKDHGLPWAESLSRVWAREMGASPADARHEFEQLSAAIERESSWHKDLG